MVVVAHDGLRKMRIRNPRQGKFKDVRELSPHKMIFKVETDRNSSSFSFSVPKMTDFLFSVIFVFGRKYVSYFRFRFRSTFIVVSAVTYLHESSKRL